MHHFHGIWKPVGGGFILADAPLEKFKEFSLGGRDHTPGEAAQTICQSFQGLFKNLR